jgi:peptidoglycan LD-endopeptidase CwlK
MEVRGSRCRGLVSAGPTLPGQGAPGVQSSLDGCAPAFRAAVTRGLNRCALDGLDAISYETLRSHALAVLYFARGRTVIPPHDAVTNAIDETYTWHGFGLADDVISKAHGWNVTPEWRAKVTAHMKAEGLKWGGDWKKPDEPHYQWALCKPSPSAAARQLLATKGRAAVWVAVGAITS